MNPTFDKKVLSYFQKGIIEFCFGPNHGLFLEAGTKLKKSRIAECGTECVFAAASWWARKLDEKKHLVGSVENRTKPGIDDDDKIDNQSVITNQYLWSVQ